MHKHILKYWAFLVMMTLFLPACQRKQVEPQDKELPEDGLWTKVHYRAEVSGSEQTRATLDDIDRHYIFERDDLMYVVDKTTGGDVLYGYLYLTTGAGSTEAVFEGDLMYFVETVPSSGIYEPERPANDLEVTATLVSKAQRDSGVYTFETDNEGKIDTGPNFGDKYASTFKEAVQKFSTFSADATYGNPSFSLVQRTAFLLFSLLFDDDVPASLTVSVTNNNGADDLFGHAVSPNGSHQASFVAAFPGGTTLSNAKLTITDGGSFNKEKALASRTLEGNHYYDVVKTFLSLDYFTIQAVAATTISFPAKYQDFASYGLQYSDDGVTWTDITTSETSFTLAAGESKKLRGKGNKYQYNDGTTPLFSSTAACYIYGDIMSLFCTVAGDVYTKKTAFDGSNNNALHGTFKNMTNLDIHPARPLLLSAQTLRQECYLEMFAGSSITRAPEFNNEGGLYAASVPTRACKWMFKDCVGLTAAPELPATSMGQESYYGMFSGCTAMETPPSRLAGTMSGSSACRQMFLGCSSLLFAPELLATDIKANGYQEMFAGCTSLTEAPELPATTVNDNSYQSMFGAVTINAVAYPGCTSMVTGPSSLPATDTNKSSCYREMFKGCSSLEAAPSIAAEGTLGSNCFREMFSGCSMLRSAQNSFSFTTIGNTSCYQMFYNCLVLNEAPDMSSVGGTIGDYGCKQMYYGCEAMTTGPSSLNATTVNQQGYYQMFYNCAHLTVSPSIAATTVLLEGCREMFRGCSRLQTPPASLPATTLENKAYMQMFYQCTALTDIPDFPNNPDADYTLPAGVDKGSLCYQMFFRCNGLESLEGKKLFNSHTDMAPFCFEDMFSECANLATVPNDFLPASTLAISCYRGMFQQTAITHAPDLLAETLEQDCYRWMFNKCTSLVYIKCYTTTSVTNDFYTQKWLENARNTGGEEFHYRDGVTWYRHNSHGIPSNWTAVPDLVP